MNGDFKILYDLLIKRMDTDSEKNDLAHKDIMDKIESHYDEYMKHPAECSKKFVSWRLITLLISITGALVLGSYGFTWAYSKHMLDIILKHIGG